MPFFVTYLYLACCEMPYFTLQNMAFYRMIDGLSVYILPSFGTPGVCKSMKPCGVLCYVFYQVLWKSYFRFVP